jgi:hypothetical protein
MKNHLVFSLLICNLLCAVCAVSQPATQRRTLQAPEEIQSYPCDKGYAWFYADGALNRCTLSHESAFGEALAPRQSIIVLTPDGKPQFLLPSHDIWIAGNNCAGGSWFGPAEGSSAAFYPSGKLKQCFLVHDQDVQGVPCMNGGIFGDGSGGGVQFHESGKLASCKLSKAFGAKQREERFVQAP